MKNTLAIGRASAKMLAFCALCLLVIPVQLLVLSCTKGSAAFIIPHFWHKGVCRIFGIRVRTHGTPEAGKQVVFLSNHISYLDIPLIGSILCPAAFVAKSDVSAWPVFGFLSKLQQTVFIKRTRSAAATENNTLDSALKNGKSLVIFPEGTSTEGVDVYPFKSSLFAIFLQDPARNFVLQPMSIKIKAVDGRTPETQDDRNFYAWHINMTTELPAHLWRFAQTKGAAIDILFHAPLNSQDFTDRKELARISHETIRKGLVFSS